MASCNSTVHRGAQLPPQLPLAAPSLMRAQQQQQPPPQQQQPAPTPPRELLAAEARLDHAIQQAVLLSAQVSGDISDEIAADVRALQKTMEAEAEATAAAQAECLQLEAEVARLAAERAALLDQQLLLKRRVEGKFAATAQGTGGRAEEQHGATAREGSGDEAAAAAAAAEPLKAGTLSGLRTAADGLQYMVYLPAAWDVAPPAGSPRHPVLLFLHGRGGVKNVENVRGQSITRMLLDGHPCLMGHRWGGADTTDDNTTGFPFIVLIPVAGQPSWQPQFPSLHSLVAMAQSDLHGDPGRTYLTGQSMGGNGAWHLAASAATGVFAAVVPVCGYLEMPPAPKRKSSKKGQQQPPQPQPQPAIPEPDQAVVRALLRKSIPIWAFHSADDTVVPVGHTDGAMKALRQQAAGAAEGQKDRLRYTRYDSAPPMVLSSGKEMAGHAAWEPAYATPELCKPFHPCLLVTARTGSAANECPLRARTLHCQLN